jgi:soluble lytic murein transglycosylase-like protein
MSIPNHLGPAGIQSRMKEIRHEMNVHLGIPEDDFASKLNQSLAPGQSLGSLGRAPDALKPLIENAAKQNGLDPDLLDCLVHQESGYNPAARSNVGAMGLTQLMPDTASGLGVSNPFDPVQNLAGGAKYLKEQLDRFGNVPEALAAYNAGPNAVIRHGGIPNYAETQNYVSTILRRYSRLKSSEVTALSNNLSGQ